MEFKQAIRIWKKMCKKHDRCSGCPMWGKVEECPDMLWDTETDVEAILAKWAEEHPEKTIADDFFEKHPKAKYLDGMVPGVCAFYCGYDKPEYCQKDAAVCANCWRRPLEEVE